MDVEMRGCRFTVVDDEFGGFWERVASGDWEPGSFRVLDEFLSPSSCFVDVGAWIGPLTLYAAHRAASCHSVEPDPRARSCLEANLALNPCLAARVRVYPVAIAESSDPRRLGNITSQGGGDGMSSLLFADGPASWPVACQTLEDLVGHIGGEPLGLVKVDIEGWEVEMLSGARDYLARSRPPLYLSVHGRFWARPRARMERLIDVLSVYSELMTPEFSRVDPDQLLDDEHLGGLFELVAV